MDEKISETLTCAWAKGTLRTRNSQWHRYLSFCQDNNLVPFPADILTIARFLIFLSSTCKFSTINNYLSAVIKLHEYYGFDQSFRDSYVIKLLLSGLKAQLGTQVMQKKYLSLEELSKMYSCVDKLDVNEITLWSAIILTFRTMLRKSNIVPDSQSQEHVVRKKDITITDKGILVKISSSKTLKHKEKEIVIPVYFVKNPGFCAASLLLSHWARREVDEDDFLFSLYSKKEWKPVSYKHLLDFLKVLCKRIGLDPNLYGLHSLRRASASFFHDAGVSLSDIMMWGDWKSLCVFQYLVLPDERKEKIESFISSKLDAISF